MTENQEPEDIAKIDYAKVWLALSRHQLATHRPRPASDDNTSEDKESA